MKKFLIVKHYMWILNLGIITGFVYLSSDIALTHIKTRLEETSTYYVEKKHSQSQRVKKRSPLFYSIIAKRDIFNSTPPSSKISAVFEDPCKDPDGEQCEEEHNKEVEPTDLNLKLLGTIVWGMKKSRAIIESADTKEQDIYKIGDFIEGAEIIDVERNEVRLLNNGKVEVLLGYDGSSQEDSPSHRRKSFNRESAYSSISKHGKNTYNIPKREINKALGNMKTLLNQARTRPHFENGKPAGYRIDNIKRNSLVGQIGIKNGDIIKSINGLALESPDEIIKMYGQLRNEPEIKIQLKRNNRLEDFTYNIR